LEAKKPKGYGINASSFREVVGKKLKAGKRAWAFLEYDDLE